MKARWLCLVLISMAVAATTMSAVDAQRPIKYINLCHQPGGCPPDLPNLTPRQAANPYRRGCSKITRCRPDAHFTMKARWLCLVLISMAVAATTMSAVDAQRPIKYINLCHQPGGCPPDLPNLTPRQAANPYRRGCSKITRCRPDV
ncbi:Protein RALF-like 2 [Camellia lanceoleosa]|uniref:Protein RALF-like 2 n=1 Tax=Camellia lanceoleosa TaxID=1840588 RepID=A0ACC0F5G6_9ERIC|nr:Protein RALF-like 2 [Camellia lanceoleosa]